MASSSIRAVPHALIPNSFKSSTVSFVSTFPLISLSRNAAGSYRAEAPQQIPEVHGGAPTWRTRMHTALRVEVLNSLPFGTPCCCPRALCRQQIFRHACTVDWYVLQQIAPPQPTQSPLSVRVRAAIEAVPFESPGSPLRQCCKGFEVQFLTPR